MKKPYLRIVSHYESCLEKHGDSLLGVDWPNKDDAETRYRVMLEVIRGSWPGKISLLDFGCGASHLYEYILRKDISNIEYSALDLSERFVELSMKKFPRVTHYCLDLMEEDAKLPNFDYIVMNGVFTEKRELSFDEMLSYFKRLVKRVFAHANIGIAFNVMSKHVEWERDDLFHLSFDVLGAFLEKEVSRHFVIRNNYGLFEYTTYVYRERV